MIYKTFLPLFVFCSILTSCDPPASSLPDLSGTSWQLITYQLDGASSTTDEAKRPWLKFEPEGKITGNTGCNSFGGSFTLEGNQLSTAQMYQTEMACVDGMEIERDFMQLLQQSNVLSKSGDQLVFKSDGGSMTFIPYDPKGQSQTSIDPGATEAAAATAKGGEAITENSEARPASYDWQVPEKSGTVAGEFAYMADAALFIDCATGERHPVAMAKAFPKLESAYRKTMGDAVGQRAYAVLKGQYQSANQPDGIGKKQTLYVDEVISLTKEGSCDTAVKKYAGMYRYMADAALFEDCVSQKRYPVAFLGANMEMERQYGQIKKEAGSPVYVEVEGFVKELPAMEGDGTEAQLIITKVLGFIADGQCR